MYAPFREWLERNIIDANVDIMVHVLVLCYEIRCAWNKKYVWRELALIWMPLFKRHKDLLLIIRV